MSHFSKDDIFEKAKDLAKLIVETDEVALYKNAEFQLNENQKVRNLIDKIKDLQKQAVNLEHVEKTIALRETEFLLDKLHKELDEMPIIQEFKRSQYEVNELLQMVTSVISNTVSNEIKNVLK
ncbi:MAG: hypothetical protein K0R71_443 [Bacillales bacterium]|jgi:cell fate (sporulation/competence/biofilm development) regulator YmcA (YheA/YmcA/DUF963 family)|nr:hypothetical protein [Bacillales bacterium]